MSDTRSLIVAAVMATAFTVGALPALAATEYDAASVWTGTNHDETFKITDTHSYMLGKSEFDSVKATDARNPMNGAKGTCFGNTAVEGHLATGNGYCIVEDAAHERFIVHWDVTAISPQEVISGNWELEGGTGKWKGAHGGGTFETVADPKTHHEVNHVSGRFSLE